VQPAESNEPGLTGVPPWLPWLLAGLVSGGLFLVPRALLVLSASPLLLVARGGQQRRVLKGALVGLLLVAGVGFAGVSWAGGVADSAQLYLLLGALPAALLQPVMNARRGAAGRLAKAAATWLVVVLGLGLANSTGGPLGVQAANAVEEAFDALLESSRSRAGEDLSRHEAVQDFERYRESVVPWVTRLLPSLVAAVGLLGMWINVVYVRWFRGGAEEREEDLCRFKLPFELIWVVLVSMAMLLLQLVVPGATSTAWGLALAVAANALLFLGVLYWLQGVAVVNWWFLRLPLSPVPRALGIGMQAVAMAIPVFSMAYLVTGLSDVWLDLRRRSGDDEVTSRNGARR